MRGSWTVRVGVPRPARGEPLEVRLRLQVGRLGLRLDERQDALGQGGGELRQDHPVSGRQVLLPEELRRQLEGRLLGEIRR